MEFLDKYMYLFDLWNVDLLKPFEDDFFTNPRERIEIQSDYIRKKFIEFQREDGALISFEFTLGRDFENHLKIYFDLKVFIDGGYGFGHNEYYLYHQKEKITEIISHLQKEITQIKKVLHKSEKEHLRFSTGKDMFDDYPDLLESVLQKILETSKNDYTKLKKIM